MGLFDNFAQRRGYEKAAPAVEKASSITSGDNWGEIFGGSGSSQSFSTFNSQKEQLAAYVDWVYAATRYIAETCATIDLRILLNHTTQKKATLGQKLIYQPVKLQKSLAAQGKKTIIEKDAKGRLVARSVTPLEEIESHPLLDLLDCPNPYMTRIEFFEMTFLHLELAGEAFWAISRDKKNGPPTELWPMMPNLVSVVADPEKFILGYEYTVNGQKLPFAPEDVIHHKYSNPNDFRRGMSPVQAAARVIDTDTHMADHNRRIFYNGATVDAVLYTDNKLNDENWKRLNQQWGDKYGGTSNSHKTAILENGLKYAPMAMTNRDLNFLEGMNFNRDQILAIFGVPKSLLGMDESMSRANAEAAEYAFSKNKVRPKMLRLTSRITEDLAIQFGDDILVSFTDPVPDDKEFVLKEKQASVGSTNQIGWRTPNEIRAEDGDTPLDGGDEVFINGNLKPMAYAAQQPELEDKPAVAQEDPGAADDDGEAQDGDEEDADTAGTGSTSDDTGTPSSAGDGGSTSSDTTTTSTNAGKTAAKPLPHQAKPSLKQISSRDFPDLYEGTGIDPANLGCVMVDTTTLPVMEFMPDSAGDLVEEGVVEAETEAHVTLLYGLLENGNVWKDKVDQLLAGWDMKSIVIDEVDAFDLGESYAIIGHVQKTDEIVDGHERLTLLPHINTFSEYKPHITLAYVKHIESVKNKWVKTLGQVYDGKMVKTIGINYGHLPDFDEDDVETKEPETEPEKCICCNGTGEHESGYECYRCDASGLEADAEGPSPCDGKFEDGNGGRGEKDMSEDDDSAGALVPKIPKQDEKGANSESAAPKVVHDTSSKVADDIASTAKTPAQLEQMQKDFTAIRDRISNKYEDDFMKAAHKRFEEQKKEVLKNVKANFKSYKPSKKAATKAQKNLLSDLFGKVKSAAAWTKALLPIYKGSVVTSGNAAFNYVADASTSGTSQQFSGADPAIQKFYTDRSSLISVGIDDTTERLLKTSLIEGISSGESVGELADRVENIYGAAAGYRALRIARTEAIDSTSFATVNAWEQSGVVSGKMWKTGSANPCTFCSKLDGKVMDLSTNFFDKGSTFSAGEGQSMKLDYDNVDGPPLHPNCCCSLLPVLAS